VANYYDIKGQKVQNLATDPSPVAEGQLWYNTTSNTAKFQSVTGASAWSSGGNRNNAVDSTPGGGGVNTDAISFGGYQPPSSPAPISSGGTGYSALSESYDGSAWTVTNPLNNGRSGVVGFGATASTTIAANGYADSPGGVFYLNATESFNGSVWTSLNNSNVNKEGATGCGLQAAGFATTGAQPNGAGNESGGTETWDGTCWTVANPAPFGTARAGCAGTSGGSVIAGGQSGYPDSKLSTAADWDGTNWTSANSLPGTRNFISMTNSPISAAVLFGGSEGSATPYNQNLNYDGTNWSTGASMARSPAGNAGASGNGTGLLAVAGGGYRTITEEFVPAGAVTTKTLTTS
jgi:hypothetical protein